MSEMTDTVDELVAGCGEVLRGHAPEVQSATLAHLVALGLAGMQPDDGIETAEIAATRDEFLELFVGLVRQLLPEMVARVGIALKQRSPRQ